MEANRDTLLATDAPLSSSSPDWFVIRPSLGVEVPRLDSAESLAVERTYRHAALGRVGVDYGSRIEVRRVRDSQF